MAENFKSFRIISLFFVCKLVFIIRNYLKKMVYISKILLKYILMFWFYSSLLQII